MPRLALAALLLGLALGPARPALSQEASAPAVRLSASAPRVLSDITDRVKGDDGAYVLLRTRLVYDPLAGHYEHTVWADGRERARRHLPTALAGPTPEEDEAARAIILGHPELARAVSRAAHPVRVSGGFPLVREAGHGCGPGSRCVQYDVFEDVPGEASGRRLRYVVVDLRGLTLFSPDFDAAREGNLAHPALGAAPGRP